MRRRQFIRFIGGAVAACPFASRAQQAATPVIGYLGTRSPTADAPFIAAFHQGLNEAGFSDGKNVTIEFRSAQNDYGRLPALAAELVQLRLQQRLRLRLFQLFLRRALTRSTLASSAASTSRAVT